MISILRQGAPKQFIQRNMGVLWRCGDLCPTMGICPPCVINIHGRLLPRGPGVVARRSPPRSRRQSGLPGGRQSGLGGASAFAVNTILGLIKTRGQPW